MLNSNKKTVPTPIVAIAFSGIYILFLICSLFFLDFLQRVFNDLSLFKDSTLIFSVLFYFTLIFIIFAAFGALFFKRHYNLQKKVIAVLPLTFFGVGLWTYLFMKMLEFNGSFGDFSWMFYTIFTLWASPAIDPLAVFISKNSHALAYIGLLPAILPGVAFVFGSWAFQKFTRKKLLLSTAVLPLLLLMAVAVSAVVPQSTKFTLETFPKMDGATAAMPLGQLLVWKLTDASLTKAKRTVNFNKSHEAYVNLIKKEADIIFVSGPSEEELQLAKEHDVELELTPVGRDAFIFIVHKENPIETLTIDQIRDIYAGNITNWQEVGGEDHEIIAYQRNANSGSQTFMETQIMKDHQLMTPPQTQQIGGMGGLITTVAEFKTAKNAVGYSFHYFASQMHKNEDIKFVAIEGIDANRETILDETYPLTATLYAVTRKDEPKDSTANELLSWMISEEGSKLLEKGGLISVN